MIAQQHKLGSIKVGTPSGLAGKQLPIRSFRVLTGQRVNRKAISVRSVLEMNKAKSSNGAVDPSKLDAAAVESDVLRELHYRLAAKNADIEKLYQAVAWSVHNRLQDSFEKTHEYWKYVVHKS